MGFIGTTEVVPRYSAGSISGFSAASKAQHFLDAPMARLKRLRKNSEFQAKSAKSIPQGLKPN
jgi:hypothetical protein